MLAARPRRFCPFDSYNQALEWQKPQFSSRICGILSADSAGVLKKSDFFNTPNAQIQIFGVLSLILAVSAEKAGTVRLPSKETVERDRQTFSGSS